MNLAKNRILTAQQSLVTLPILEKNSNSSDSINSKSSNGLNPPPPSRVSSIARLAELDIMSKLNEYVFEESRQLSGNSSSTDQTYDEDDNDVDVEEKMFCVKDDDGLILKFDRSEKNYDPDDYGSELHIVPDPIYDARGKDQQLELKNEMMESCDDFVEIQTLAK